MTEMNLAPNPTKAAAMLVEHRDAIFHALLDARKPDLALEFSEAVAHLLGYTLPPEVRTKYRCTPCGNTGVKLWRGVGSAQEAWCAKCACAQAGLPDDIGEDGRRNSELTGGLSDQVYSSKKGQSLLPWVPGPDGYTWGYTSVPAEGVLWWRSLPTRVRDPRRDPKEGDKLRLLGWKIEVSLSSIGDDSVTYWRDGGRGAGRPRDLITCTLTEWREQMGKYAIVEATP